MTVINIILCSEMIEYDYKTLLAIILNMKIKSIFEIVLMVNKLYMKYMRVLVQI